MHTDVLILSCEHASGSVPARYNRCFASASAQRALASHRGLDIGALGVARAFRRAFRCPLFHARVTRLLVDTNRSPHHARLHSEFSRTLPASERTELLQAYYYPYRIELRNAVAAIVRSGQRAVHVSLHSFTPRLAGQVRTADIGLLYDPARAPEARFAARWREQLGSAAPALRVRRNYPYRGVDDGLCTWLRSEFSARSYLGIELEMNQRFFLDHDRDEPAALVSALIATLPTASKRAARRS